MLRTKKNKPFYEEASSRLSGIREDISAPTSLAADLNDRGWDQSGNSWTHPEYPGFALRITGSADKQDQKIESYYDGQLLDVHGTVGEAIGRCMAWDTTPSAKRNAQGTGG